MTSLFARASALRLAAALAATALSASAAPNAASQASLAAPAPPAPRPPLLSDAAPGETSAGKTIAGETATGTSGRDTRPPGAARRPFSIEPFGFDRALTAPLRETGPGLRAAATALETSTVAAAGQTPRRRTLRLGLGGDIALAAPNVWGLRAAAGARAAALASDLALANAARLPRRGLRDLSPPLAEETDVARIAAIAEEDDKARAALSAVARDPAEIAMADALGVSFLENRDWLRAAPSRARTETRCLAEAIYFEARGESLRGQAAVAEVVLNRVESRFWPNTVCGVVNQGSERTTGCQFSYTCDGIEDVVRPGSAWTQAQDLAVFMLRGGPRRITGRATHYHADYVDPPWAKTMERTATVETHIFYRRLLRFRVREE
ncbi:MAG: cell wall hydrolase [Pseudomonadota bacterium]